MVGRQIGQPAAFQIVGDRGVEATGVAYRDQQQFGDIQQAMSVQRLHNYRLVPEARAALAVSGHRKRRMMKVLRKKFIAISLLVLR